MCRYACDIAIDVWVQFPVAHENVDHGEAWRGNADGLDVNQDAATPGPVVRVLKSIEGNPLSVCRCRDAIHPHR
jgi:hypothetical protein